MPRVISNVRCLALLLTFFTLVSGMGPTGAQQGPSVEEMVARLRDRADVASRRDELLDELRRNLESGDPNLTIEQRRRALERIKLQPMIDLEIPFDYNKAELSTPAFPVLQKLVVALPKASPRSEFLIIGHTDNVGTDAYNQQLSVERANKIRDFIIKNADIRPNRLLALGVGSLVPLYPNTPSAPANRRVHIINIGPPPPAMWSGAWVDVLRIGPLLLDKSAWGVIAMTILSGLAIGYWRTARSIKETLKKSGEQVASLHTVFENLRHASHTLEGKMQRLESMESNVARLSGAVDTARREAHDVEKHVDSLATKSDIAATEVAAIKHRVDTGDADLKRIDDQIKDTTDRGDRAARHIKRLEHDVHDRESVKRTQLTNNNIGWALKRIAAEVKSNASGIARDGRHIEHLEHEVHGFQGPKNHEGSTRDDFDSRRRATAELESADRKIETLMGETIQIEAGYQNGDASASNGTQLAQQLEEHHRKLIEAAQQIFRDVRKYLGRPAIQAMEVQDEQLDWSRGELFANAASPEAAMAYHQQVKDYFIKLREVTSRRLHEIA
jgi:outer membrane protein OmpA-like peptidoglycan-associated protein/uncharacterized protein YoxC